MPRRVVSNIRLYPHCLHDIAAMPSARSLFHGHSSVPPQTTRLPNYGEQPPRQVTQAAFNTFSTPVQRMPRVRFYIIYICVEILHSLRIIYNIGKFAQIADFITILCFGNGTCNSSATSIRNTKRIAESTNFSLFTMQNYKNFYIIPLIMLKRFSVALHSKRFEPSTTSDK